MTKKQRDRYLKRKYGISIKEYDRMFKAQKGKCAVCGKSSKKGKNLHVDHDHANGEVRGLLDFYCNKRIIGRNNESTIRKLVAYLMPDYKLELDLVAEDHVQEMEIRHMICNCLICVRKEVNRENKMYKPRS